MSDHQFHQYPTAKEATAMSHSLTLTDHLYPDDHAHVHRVSAPATSFAYIEIVENEELAGVHLTRAQAHELHAWLTAELGLCSPTPVAPLTASRPAAARRVPEQSSPLSDRPAHKGYSLDVV